MSPAHFCPTALTPSNCKNDSGCGPNSSRIGEEDGRVPASAELVMKVPSRKSGTKRQ